MEQYELDETAEHYRNSQNYDKKLLPNTWKDEIKLKDKKE